MRSKLRILVAMLPLMGVGAINASETSTVHVRISFQTYPVDPLGNDALMVSPLWYGFHNGEFDAFQIGQMASEELRTFAENWGQVEGLTEAFDARQPNGVTGSIENLDWRGTGLDPSNQLIAEVHPIQNRFFSYLGRLTPSDDGFVGNDDPHRIELFDSEGNWKGPQVITVFGTEVLDAGVRENSEMDIQFLTNDVEEASEPEELPIRYHPGYNGSLGNPQGEPQLVLGGEYFDPVNNFLVEYHEETTDFTQKNFRLMRVRIERYSALDGRYSGPWYNPARDGEGFSIHVVDREDPRIVIYWFTYAPDGSGEQVWLIGVLPVGEDNLGTVDMFEFRGGEFNSTSNPETAMGEFWGTLTFDFTNCRRGTVAFEPKEGSPYEAGEFSIERLSAPPLGLEEACPKF